MNILLAIDNSPHSHVAVEVLLNRTWAAGTAFKVLCVVEPLFAVMKREEARVFDNTALEEAQKFSDDIAAELQAKFPSCSAHGEAILGDSKELILKKSDEWPADLVVVGSRGRQGLPSFFLGSVSQTVLIYGKCSTLIARSQQERTDAAECAENVLLAIDNTTQSKIAFDWVMNMAWSEKAKFRLLTVLPPIVDKYSDGFDALNLNKFSDARVERSQAAEQFLNRNLKTLEAKVGTGKVIAELREGDPGESILQLASAWPAGLVVMGARSHGKMSRLFLGSVSQEVVLQAPCPVEVVKTGVLV